MSKSDNKCAASVYPRDRWGAFHPHRCERRGVLYENEQWWCRLHAPSSVEAKTKARTAKWDQEWQEKKKQWAETERKQKAMEKAIVYLRGVYPHNPKAKEIIDLYDGAALLKGDADENA